MKIGRRHIRGCLRAGAILCLTSVAAFSQSEDEIKGLYFKEIACAGTMSLISVSFEKVNQAKLAKAFEDDTQKHIEQAIEYGKKLKMTQDAVIAEAEQQSKLEVEKGFASEDAVMSAITSCSPELLPLMD